MADELIQSHHLYLLHGLGLQTKNVTRRILDDVFRKAESAQSQQEPLHHYDYYNSVCLSLIES